MGQSKFVDLQRRFSARDAERESRIRNEVTVDAHGDQEVITSWYYYLEKKLSFPFEGTVETHKQRYSSSMGYNSSEVTILGLAPMQRCGLHQIWAMGKFFIPPITPIHILLTDLLAVDADEARKEALEDWLYWNRNINFGLWELK